MTMFLQVISIAANGWKIIVLNIIIKKERTLRDHLVQF